MKKRNDKTGKILNFCLCIVFVFLVAVVGSLFISPEADDWYDSIKPSISPPPWVFIVVWNILYIIIALSLYFACVESKSAIDRTKVISIFAINLILNVLWSYVFFGLHESLWALYNLTIIWLSIVVMMAVVFEISKKSFWLLVPYIMWISFAVVLNYLSYLNSLRI